MASVVPLCSAFAAQDTGSTRQALRLLYLAGKRTADNSEKEVTENHVRGAKEELDQSKVIEGMQKLTTQGHAVLISLASHAAKGETPVRTRDPIRHPLHQKNFQLILLIHSMIPHRNFSVTSPSMPRD
ncbi:hypothetical protein [Haladaptatus caseinilyticus]|uniref:hypothetical protein n=1 Tax=Haladaptatus caseinilyticus TaxID=2993314 RepID=UPI0038992316